MTRAITSIDAVRLATRYHDAMTMVSRKSFFHLPAGTSPRQCLEGYLQACKVCGVKMHNDEWEAHAEKVVEEISQKIREALAQLLKA